MRSIRWSLISQCALLGLFIALPSAAQPAPAAAAVTQKTVAAARTFLGMLSETQLSVVRLDLNKTTRSKWSNLPSAPGYRDLRNGIPMGELSTAQQDAALALIAAILSPSGYQKVLNILNAEEIRTSSTAAPSSLASPSRFKTAEFQFAVLGEPSLSEPWMIQFGGHHLALNITIAGGASALTPLHTGTEPIAYDLNGQIVRPLGREHDKAFALIGTLNEAQQKQAILNYQGQDTVFGPGHDGEILQPSGIRGSNLNAHQQAMLVDLISEWVEILNNASAPREMTEIRSNIADTYFAWSGPANPSQAYFRIQGPTVEIEYAPQGSPNHIHTFYRNPSNDYGTKFIKP